MFKHLFKLIWNKKKQNFLLMTEILVSFVVLFAVFTLMIYYYQNYKKPMGMEYENVWVINYDNAYNSTNIDSLDRYYETLRQTIKTMPGVKAVSFSSPNIPLTQNNNIGAMKYGDVKLDNVNHYRVDDSYKDVLHTQVLEGRWFNKQDYTYKYKPIVINSNLRELAFGKGPAIGKLLTSFDGKDKMRVIGVIQSIKVKGDYADPGNASYFLTDTGSYHWLSNILVSVNTGTDVALEGKLYKTLANYMKNANIEINHLTADRTSTNYFAVVPIVVLSIVSGFLIINVAMGLFGVLWYNINRRRGEIGLRRAVGATGNAVSAQLVSESMIMATFALLIGTFFAVQFPLLNVFNLEAGIYISALLLTILFIYLLVMVCSLYPGKQAGRIYPAVALHEE